VALGAALAIASVLYARQTWQPYKSHAVLVYDQALPRDMGVFDPAQAGGRIKDLLYSTDRVRAVVTKYDLFPEYSTQQAIEEVKKRLEFQVQPGGAFALSYIGFSPQQAQTVLRELSETLIVDHNQQRSRQVKQTREFLDAELVRLTEDVRARETTLKEFLAKHPEAASINDDQPMVDPASLVLEQQLAQLRSQARTRSPGGGAGRSTSEIVELKRAAETERETAQRDLQAKLDTLTEAHPDVIVARERLKRAQGEVGRFNGQLEKASGISSGQGASADALEIKAMETKLAEMRSVSTRRRSRDPRALQAEVQLQDLRHNLEEARKRLSAVESEKVQASVMEKMDSTGNFLRLRIHDPATLAGSPMQSRRRRFAMGGFMLACLVAMGTALGRAMMSDRIFDRNDVVNLGGAPVLAVVPPVPKRLRGAGD
jgi:polysaccharide biosynthesis transport protein